MKLGTLLLRDAVITLSQLEEALRAQVLFGGRLGTNLVELGFIDLNTLGACLAKVNGVPIALQDRFEAVTAATIEAFPAALVDEFAAFPLGPEPRAPERLAVALADARRPVIEALAARLGCPISPYVAPELRIFYYIERHFGLQRSARYLRPADPSAAPTSERRRTQPSPTLPTPITFEPRRSRPRTSAPPTPAGRPVRVSYAAACDAIDGAGHRDEIADILLLYCSGRFALAVLFILRNKNALGWRALAGDDRKIRAVEQLALPLGGSSALQIAHDTALPFHGGPPAAGRPIERQLWRELGVVGEPDDVAVIPVVVRKRVVNLVYVHGFDGQPVDGGHLDELTRLALRAADAYVGLIQATKAGDGG